MTDYHFSLISSELDTPDFRAAWQEWIDHRREIRKPVTARAARSALRRIATFGGHDAAVAALDHSVAAGYQGIFPAPAAPKTSQPKDRPLSTWEIKEKLQACENRFNDLLYPGGCATRATLTGSAEAEARQLHAQIKDLKAQLRSS